MRAFQVRMSDIAKCPVRSLLPDHYRSDGSCLHDTSTWEKETVEYLRSLADRVRYHEVDREDLSILNAVIEDLAELVALKESADEPS